MVSFSLVTHSSVHHIYKTRLVKPHQLTSSKQPTPPQNAFFARKAAPACASLHPVPPSSSGAASPSDPARATMDWQPDAAAADGYICPPCPVFHPTAAEFQDPLKYITR